MSRLAALLEALERNNLRNSETLELVALVRAERARMYRRALAHARAQHVETAMACYSKADSAMRNGGSGHLVRRMLDSSHRHEVAAMRILRILKGEPAFGPLSKTTQGGE